jgi:hypothetical protein
LFDDDFTSFTSEEEGLKRPLDFIDSQTVGYDLISKAIWVRVRNRQIEFAAAE